MNIKVALFLLFVGVTVQEISGRIHFDGNYLNLKIKNIMHRFSSFYHYLISELYDNKIFSDENTFLRTLHNYVKNYYGHPDINDFKKSLIIQDIPFLEMGWGEK